MACSPRQFSHHLKSTAMHNGWREHTSSKTPGTHRRGKPTHQWLHSKLLLWNYLVWTLLQSVLQHTEDKAKGTFLQQIGHILKFKMFTWSSRDHQDWRCETMCPVPAMWRLCSQCEFLCQGFWRIDLFSPFNFGVLSCIVCSEGIRIDRSPQNIQQV